MKSADPMPRRILVVGSTGIIGRGVLNILCGKPPVVQRRVTFLERNDEPAYRVVACEQVELAQRDALRPWIERQPEAVVYLAGAPAHASANEAELGCRVNVQALAEALEAIEHMRLSLPVIYASSTAVHNPVDNVYAEQKLQGERTLTAGGVQGVALRFPTVLPRSPAASRTSTLNDSIRQLLQGRASVWPVSADRKIRVMSTAAAARHVVAALSFRSDCGALALDLPATVVTPRSLCKGAGAPEPSIELDGELEALLARRLVEIDTNAARELGFPEAESLSELVAALRASSNP
jgi:nucleoside-diphosphate-sugar epimerase